MSKIIGEQKYGNGTRKVLRCACGDRLVLSSFTNTCDGCGADYNMQGDRLADRRFWGEETGETAADIMMGNPFDE